MSGVGRHNVVELLAATPGTKKHKKCEILGTNRVVYQEQKKSAWCLPGTKKLVSDPDGV